jgi:ATP/maltotriose-dependent transcriptional regulator MalT
VTAARLVLGAEDADPVRLWRSLILALRASHPAFGRDAEAMLAAGPAALAEAVIPLVAAEVALLAIELDLELIGVADAALPSLLVWSDCAPPGARIRLGAGEPGAPPRPTAQEVARDWPATLARGEHATVLRWVDATRDDHQGNDDALLLPRLWAAHQQQDAARAEQLVADTVDARALLLHADAALRAGDLDQLADRLDLVTATTDPRDGFWHTFEALLRAHEALWRGHPRVAARHFARAAGLAHVHRDPKALAAALGYLALLATEGGDDDSARRRLNRIEDLVDADPSIGEHAVAIGGAHAEGRLLELAGPHQPAVAPLNRAIALAERGGSAFERAEPRLRLAAVHRACRRSELASILEAEALQLLQPCPDHGRLAGPAAAIAPSGGGSGSSPAGTSSAAPLSPSERAVLRLLPSELSQREIGGTLFLSVNTVKTHCRNIYTKLHAQSREEAVARAHDLGLL